MPSPLVSVICLSYNHASFVEEAIRSILDQTYSEVELIVVDDASTDNSVSVIENIITQNGDIKFIKLNRNVGNCTAFNIGFAQSRGEFVIDFAADDVLLPQRIEEGVNALMEAGSEFGVQFSDAAIIDKSGDALGFHSDKYPHSSIPQGDIYKEVIHRYFICGASMLVRREVMEMLNGYDEKLAYEDFDFWVRSARRYKYLYLPKVMVKKRVLKDSMVSRQFIKGSSQLRSTYEVCRKINTLNETEEEDKALRSRIRYEIKVCLRLFDFSLAADYFRLLREVSV